MTEDNTTTVCGHPLIEPFITSPPVSNLESIMEIGEEPIEDSIDPLPNPTGDVLSDTIYLDR